MMVAVATGAQAASAGPGAGTEGRGGASLTVAKITPSAGTDGRGGVAAFDVATLAGEPVVAENGFVSRARGGFPSGPNGVERTLATSSGASSSGGWIAAAIVAAAVAIMAGFFAWAASRRRKWQQESSLASYCTYHSADALCRAS